MCGRLRTPADMFECPRKSDTTHLQPADLTQRSVSSANLPSEASASDMHSAARLRVVPLISLVAPIFRPVNAAGRVCSVVSPAAQGGASRSQGNAQSPWRTRQAVACKCSRIYEIRRVLSPSDAKG